MKLLKSAALGLTLSLLAGGAALAAEAKPCCKEGSPCCEQKDGKPAPCCEEKAAPKPGDPKPSGGHDHQH